MKRTIIYITLQLVLYFCLNAQNEQQSSTRFAVKAPQEIFIGGLIKANGINKAEHQFLKVQMNPIALSYTIPLKSETIIPSYENMINAIQKRLEEDNVLKPNYQFSFTIKQLDAYSQLALSFGEKIDLSTLLGISSPNLTKKTAAMLDISQSYFSIHMDNPENLSDDPSVQEQKNELVYVNSIEFGKRAILILESDYDYQDIKAALNEVITNTSTQKGNEISQKSKSIMANSIVRTLILDPLAKENITPDNPLAYLIDYINSEVSPKNFGVPIFFTAAWLKDNSVFENKF